MPTEEAIGRPEASFIVIAYNEAENIERTLRSITAQRGLSSYEVVVVDDGSADGTADAARRYASEDPNVRVVALPENQGRGHARSVGVDEARGGLLATVDADIVLPDHWYERCRAGLDEDADAVAGVAVPDGDVQYLYKRFGLEPRPLNGTIEVSGCNALYRRDVFDRAGFDAELREGEDVAMNHAMREAGARMRRLEGLHVRHEENKDFRGELRWLFESGIGAARQLRRYRQVRPPDIAFAGWLATTGVAAALARRTRGASLALPLAYTGAAAVAHAHQRFVLDPRRPGTVAGALAADAALLTAYFAGRVAGLPRA